MRALVALFLLAGAATADLDRVTDLVEAEEFERAYKLMQSDPAQDTEDGRFWDLWQRAVRGVARNKQRVGGYEPALEFLEDHLDTVALVDDYTETCIWAGEEARGLQRIRELSPSMRKRCVVAEFQLHWVRQDYATFEQRAIEMDKPKWAAFAREQRELRERFTHRTTRAWWVALLGTAVILLACWIVDWRLRPRSA